LRKKKEKESVGQRDRRGSRGEGNIEEVGSEGEEEGGMFMREESGLSLSLREGGEEPSRRKGVTSQWVWAEHGALRGGRRQPR